MVLLLLPCFLFMFKSRGSLLPPNFFAFEGMRCCSSVLLGVAGASEIVEVCLSFKGIFLYT